MNAFISPSLPPPPPPVANISGKIFLGALFIPKVPLETGAPPQLFYASYAPVDNQKRAETNSRSTTSSGAFGSIHVLYFLLVYSIN